MLLPLDRVVDVRRNIGMPSVSRLNRYKDGKGEEKQPVRCRPGKSRVCATTENNNQHIHLKSRRDRTSNDADSKTISSESIEKGLHVGGLYALRPMESSAV
ncbi:hypothetical protein TNCV_824851 [Trichonephila clavipes]|nr:hypothetical protein TNCV_824851 [Trichonephila clavipes]